MAGLNNIREAYEQVYNQLDERMDPEERALRRAEVADKKASRMEPKVAAKYAGSEARSAEREDKKSRGKHIHGMAHEGRDYLGRDHGGSEEEHQSNVRFGERMKKLQGKVTYEKEKSSEKKLKEAVYGGEKKEPEDKRMTVTAADQKANTKAWQNYKAGHPSYKAAPHLTKEEMIAHLQERALDYAEKREKESVFKAIKPSKLAKTYPEKSPKELKSLRYAISTAQAKKNMDTSRSDKRYGKED